MKPAALVTAALLVIAGIGGVGYYAFKRPADIFEQCRTSSTVADIGGPFELTDNKGRPVTDKDVIDGLTLVYFGYTYCPDVCPLDTARNAEAVSLLEDQGIMVKPVFITIDPARDTPEALDEFVSYIHPRMVGLTGPEDRIKAVAKAYQVYFSKQVDPEDPEFYLMEHMTNTYLMDPEYGFLQFFDRTVRPEQMAKTVACYADVIKNN